MEFYPAGPVEVPANLTLPTRAYRLHAWLASLGLLAFIAGYLTLTAWFGYLAFRTAQDALEASAGAAVVGFLLAVPPAFFCAFLAAGALAVRNHRPEGQLEISARDEPKLFAFLQRLAKEARSPMPHRVFLSSGVNAAVFYDLSVLNLIIPSKKNLEIGLGLVNALDVGEFKAVIAHEFGHFAQSAMAVGRWTYLAQQIAGNIIARRGAFDRTLSAIARFDFRVAWLGWLMQLLVWSIRAVLDTAFRGVVLAGRALSREMELQADLVAVSVTGSDCLVHALRKLHAADDANARAHAFAEAELRQGRPIDDLFAVQARITEVVRAITGDAAYGAVPPLPQQGRDGHRIFAAHFAQPPKMWSTHPPNREREDNVKRRYVPSQLDERPSWILFADPAATRRQVTRHLLSSAVTGTLGPALPTELTLEIVTRQFGRNYHAPCYRARYLGPSIVREARTPRELYVDEHPPQGWRALDQLYPASLREDLELWRELEAEHAMLIGLREGLLTAPGGLIRHRGQDVRKRDLARAIEQVERERCAAKQRVLEHDRECRSAHVAAARAFGPGWTDYLVGLISLLHYAEHTLANLEDAAGHLRHVFAVVSADGRVSKRELRRLLVAADALHAVLGDVLGHRLVLPAQVAQRLQVESWRAALPRERLIEAPSSDNLGPWLEAVGSWVGALCGALGGLCEATLEALLATEACIALHTRHGTHPGEAPLRAVVPTQYEVMLPGSERPRQKRLDLWDRIQLADGVLPGALRLSAAASLLGAALLMGAQLGGATVHVYNGLEIPVTVRLGEHEASLEPGAHARLEVAARHKLHVEALTRDERAQLESFDADAHNTLVNYVYNVARAKPLVEWTAVYGNAHGPAPRRIGRERWLTSGADVLFGDPPGSVRIRGGGATRSVLSALDE